MRKDIILLLVLLGVSFSFSQNPNFQGPPSQSDWDTAISKAQKFVAKLTNTDKSNLATGVGWEGGPCVGNTPAIKDVSFGGFCLQDSPTGVRYADHVSAFPVGINVAATWNRSMAYARGSAMAQEFRGKGVNIALGPMMNMGRVAAGGRNWEGFGADPFLTGEMAFHTIVGIQDQGVIACAKHFILNEQEHYRTTETSNIDDRTLHEFYFWPFIQSVKAGVGSVMCSYNQINSVYACQSNYTLNQVLKGQADFKGFVMSDWSATMSGVPSVLAGLDMTMPGDITFGSGTTYFGPHLVTDVSSGQITQARLDDMAIRIMTPYFLLGQDQGYPNVTFDFRDQTKGTFNDVQGDHYIIIRQLAAESNVLLKNVNNQLPFTAANTAHHFVNFGLIGSDAGPANKDPNECQDHSCDDGTLAQGWGSGTTNFPYLVSPLEAFQGRAAATGQTILYTEEDWDLTTAKNIAKLAAVAIVFVNADSGEGYLTVDGNAGDRNNLSLWHNADNLVKAVASVNPHTVVVVHTVGPVLMPWITNPNVTAVIVAGLPGQESGNSLCDVLFGDVNPSGKLPYTIAAKSTDYPASVLYSSSAAYPNINYTEGLFVDYRWFDASGITPTFEFGFGLSYTTFAYSNLEIEQNTASSDPFAYVVSATITNTGSVQGQEVAQLYVASPDCSEPPKILRGFEKTWINPGSSVVVSFNLTSELLSVWNVSMQEWVVPEGVFGVYVGASSRILPLQGSFNVSGANSVLVDATVCHGAPDLSPPATVAPTVSPVSGNKTTSTLTSGGRIATTSGFSTFTGSPSTSATSSGALQTSTTSLPSTPSPTGLSVSSTSSSSSQASSSSDSGGDGASTASGGQTSSTGDSGAQSSTAASATTGTPQASTSVSPSASSGTQQVSSTTGSPQTIGSSTNQATAASSTGTSTTAATNPPTATPTTTPTTASTTPTTPTTPTTTPATTTPATTTPATTTPTTKPTPTPTSTTGPDFIINEGVKMVPVATLFYVIIVVALM